MKQQKENADVSVNSANLSLLQKAFTVESRLKYVEKGLEENTRILNKLLRRMEEMHRFIVWYRVWGFLKVLLILAPIFWAIIYLPPILENLFAPYKDLLGGSGGKGLDVNAIIESIKSGN